MRSLVIWLASAGYIDANFPGGYGVVLDDVVSGVYSNAVVRLLIAVGLVT